MENVNTCSEQLINPNVLHIQYKFKNNRVENSHQLTRERERRMRGFKPAGLAQRFLANFGAISSFFKVGRHLRSAKNYRGLMCKRFAQWTEVVRLAGRCISMKFHKRTNFFVSF